jgi:hypothetical protein
VLLQYPIRWLIAAYLVLGGIYAFFTPLFEISDELWHYPMVKRLADGQGLPFQDPANVGPWRQEGSQPPLYYYLMAGATFWIDTSDMDTVRWLNPHADNGIVTEDRNNNIAIHRPGEIGSLTGTVLAVRLIRLLSVGLGAITVYATFRLSLEVLPGKTETALAAAAIVGFTPMFLFISASVNNDNLAITLSTLSLWLLATFIRRPATRLEWRHLALGVLIGAGALSKQSALGLIGLAGAIFGLQALVMVVGGWTDERTDRRMDGPTEDGLSVRSSVRLSDAAGWLLLQLGVVSALTLAVAFWWYWRNYTTYGDWLGWSAFLDIVGRRPQPAGLWQLWGERVGFVQAYWGLFGGVSVAMPGWIYTLLNTLAALAGVGLLVRLWRARRGTSLADAMCSALPLLWIGALLYGLVAWSSQTWASQGRLIFPAIGAISVLLAAGWAAFGQRDGQAGRQTGGQTNGQTDKRRDGWKGDRLSVMPLPIVLAAIAVWAPFGVIAPHYAPPVVTAVPSEARPIAADFGGELTLVAIVPETEVAWPGEDVRFDLYWKSQLAMDRNWSVFVHLVDAQGVIVAQRDRYPGEGLLATTLATPGTLWRDRYAIRVPDGAAAPAQLQLVVGVYDLQDGYRLPVEGRESQTVGQIRLEPRAGAAPNPTPLVLAGQIALSGYRVSAQRLRPGETFEVELFWYARRPIERNYAVSVRVRAEGDDTRWAAFDSWPQQGAAPTSAWRVGEPVRDPYTLTLDAETPPGQYFLEVLVYDAETQALLQLDNAEGYPSDATAMRLAGLVVAP